MERPDIIRALRIAHDEIVTLQRRVSDLEPRAQAYDHISTILGLMPGQNSYSRPDPAWEVKRAHDELVAERVAEQAAEGPQP